MTTEPLRHGRWLDKGALWGMAGVTALVAIVTILVLSFLGPSVGNVFSNIVSNLPASPYPIQPASANLVSQQPETRLIIREGALTLAVKDTRAVQKDIERIVAEFEGEGAFTVSSQETGGAGEGSPHITMEIRVPAARFDEVMERLAALAVEVYERTETAQDVTEEYVDAGARLEALEAARDRLLEIMKHAATTEALLQAEQQLTQREAEVQALKGRLQYLGQAAQLARISLRLQPHVLSQPIDRRWRPAETARQAVETLVHSLQGAADFLIYVGIVLLPWLVFIGLVGYGGVRVARRRSAARPQDQINSTPPGGG